jgi:hypothetical protein
MLQDLIGNHDVEELIRPREGITLEVDFSDVNAAAAGEGRLIGRDLDPERLPPDGGGISFCRRAIPAADVQEPQPSD